MEPKEVMDKTMRYITGLTPMRDRRKVCAEVHFSTFLRKF